uniref:Methyltransferase domain-containing protein n=1 Tax=Fervidicoccus fontis TaxID=683846 RepID=A0A7C1E3M0_9CREN
MKACYQKQKIYGLEICVSDNVYQPSDDSFLITNYIFENPHEFSNKNVIDLGSGTGILSLAVLKTGANYVLAIDINPYAVQATKCTLQTNGFESFDVIRCDSISCLREISNFEIVLYNPPYLPIDTSEDECIDWVARAWCGGASGVEAIIKALEMLGNIGRPRKVLLVVSTLSRYMDVINRLEDLGYRVEELSSRKFFFEEIKLIRGVMNG